MRVTLTIPPWTFRDVYPAAMAEREGFLADGHGRVTGVTEPLGLLLVAATLRNAGHRPVIVDGYGQTDEAWLDDLVKTEPEAVGLSLMSFGWERSGHLVREIRRRMPRVAILAGGPHPSAAGKAMLAEEADLDYVIGGPGEYAAPALITALENGSDPTATQGLVYRKDGEIRENPGDPIKDLDALPFAARDLVDMRDYRPSVGFYNRLPSVSMMTTRGCPRTCRFCVSENTYARRSAANVIVEIAECVKRYDARHILFWDEDIAVSKSHINALCAALEAFRPRVSWCASMSIERVRPDLVRSMRRAGCWKILFGLESGATSTLETLGKPTDLSMVADRLTTVRRAGIETYATFMFGTPGETREEGEKTIRFARGLPLDYAVFLYFTPFPGTPYFPQIDRLGRGIGLWSMQAPSFVPHSMSLGEMVGLYERAYRRFYLRPRAIARKLTTVRSMDDVMRYVKGFFSVLKLRRLIDGGIPLGARMRDGLVAERA
ncbi:MAG: B12-binding domain-containing radical SAM protein [Deltaproteobacteria bacterium]|nr:B12-binding domain-containing radical SAM protein [Deltaproteobacteria bacterium]